MTGKTGSIERLISLFSSHILYKDISTNIIFPFFLIPSNIHIDYLKVSSWKRHKHFTCQPIRWRVSWNRECLWKLWASWDTRDPWLEIFRGRRVWTGTVPGKKLLGVFLLLIRNANNAIHYSDYLLSKPWSFVTYKK